MSIKIENFTIHEAARLLEEKKISSTELCKAYIERAKKLEPKVKAFLKLDEEDVLSQAKASDDRRAENRKLGQFDGIPLAVKDNITVKGQTCTCASKILQKVVSPYDATVIRKLKANGFVLFGRTNMDEFAMGSSCENSAYQKTANPWNINCVPGGSSGGSAASVSAAEVTAALGSDTGGSIRQPASFCGVVGFKPTYGRISRYGLIAFASSLDQIGPITRDVEDAAILTDVMCGRDSRDATSLPDTNEIFSEDLGGLKDLKGIRIGLPKECFEIEGLDAGVRKSMEKSIQVFKDLGAEMVQVSLPHSKYAVATYYVIATAEASANLARFDGIRYGNRMKADDLLETYLETRGAGFGDEVKRRIILGTFVLSSGYYDAYYTKGQKVRTLIRRDFQDAYRKCDVILTPVSPTTAFKFGEKSDPLQMYLADIFTISTNLAGICGISVPADIHENGLPVGIQLLGPDMGEKQLLRISHIFEKNRAIKEFIPGI
ncbi:MAG TPA: Asp-tRNA(Asn)/Glu-tRNA(Gln) amidotransferase GatCAB subunit A [Lentisphaeria bacterium]|nr:Asp-tRNA(Asn)/Glu-tRNA(Gln) amidotransferase GatCAB subunit A [Lentisphaeria bacterium]